MSARKVSLLTDTQTMILYLTTRRLPVSDIAERLHLKEEDVETEFLQGLRKLKSRSLRRLFGQLIGGNPNFQHTKTSAQVPRVRKIPNAENSFERSMYGEIG